MFGHFWPTTALHMEQDLNTVGPPLRSLLPIKQHLRPVSVHLIILSLMGGQDSGLQVFPHVYQEQGIHVLNLCASTDFGESHFGRQMFVFIGTRERMKLASVRGLDSQTA